MSPDAVTLLSLSPSIPPLLHSPKIFSFPTTSPPPRVTRPRCCRSFAGGRCLHMADEPSDACSRTDEDNARSRRKKRRYSNVYSYADEEDSVRIRKQRKVFSTAVFAAVVAMVIYVIFDEEAEEEDDDEQADLLQSSLDCLEAVKAWVGCELGPNNGISEKIIAALQDIPDLEQDDVSSTHEIFASDDRKVQIADGTSNGSEE